MKKTTTIFIMLAMVISLMACSNSGSGGQKNEFPKKSVSMIVPYSAGGGTDAVARALASATESYLGQPMAILNKTGGGGAVGMTEGANAKADGYTVTMITLALSTMPHAGLAPISYKDFTPIALINMDPATITVPTDSPFHTLNDIIKYAKENPGKLKVGNSGSGLSKDYAGALFEEAAGISMTHVPFEGAAPTINALLGNHIDVITVTTGEVLAQVQGGKLKTLGVMAEERAAVMPDVPTMKELGLDIGEFGPWRGLGVPKDTPAEVVKTLSDAFSKAVNDEKFKTFMEQNGFRILFKDSAQFSEFLEQDYTILGEMIKNMK
ncbi:tripartite tricarboxylate transporter substrate binding protein [Paenibacillus sp. GCM10027626]|uniref:tripartite tricarboxylate transporter substrate binding protein n=1 Tax=Paenibacillus sp. GCM10027626 TaxID=3273411 RepID=UPI00362E5EED